jgi:hypothetical protein
MGACIVSASDENDRKMAKYNGKSNVTSSMTRSREYWNVIFA